MRRGGNRVGGYGYRDRRKGEDVAEKPKHKKDKQEYESRPARESRRAQAIFFILYFMSDMNSQQLQDVADRGKLGRMTKEHFEMAGELDEARPKRDFLLLPAATADCFTVSKAVGEEI